MARKFVISKNVVDLREDPTELIPKDFSHHDSRLTQLLYGEEISILESQGTWHFIEAVEQLRHHEENGWYPYRGWIHHSEITPKEPYEANLVVVKATTCLKPQGIELSYGTYLSGTLDGNIILQTGEKSRCDPDALRLIPKSINRHEIVQDARLFLGAPYLWGGRSGYMQEMPASVDCSGLISLLYRAQGLQIPRDAHEQHLRGQHTDHLLPGDAVYLTKKERITHVILYLGDDLFIESPETGKAVRVLRLDNEIMIREDTVSIEGREGIYKAYFRAFIN